MNSLKGPGACTLLAAVAYALTRMADVDRVILVVTVPIISASLLSFAGAVRRSRRDRGLGRGSRRR